MIILNYFIKKVIITVVIVNIIFQDLISMLPSTTKRCKSAKRCVFLCPHQKSLGNLCTLADQTRQICSQSDQTPERCFTQALSSQAVNAVFTFLRAPLLSSPLASLSHMAHGRRSHFSDIFSSGRTGLKHDGNVTACRV